MLTSKSKLVQTAKSMVKDTGRPFSWTVSVTDATPRTIGPMVMLFVNINTLSLYGSQLATSTLKENRDFVEKKGEQIAKAANRFVQVINRKKKTVAL
jgi:hypothetical protein